MSRLQNAPKETLSPNEAARILNITGEAVKQWIYHGRLPAVKLPNGYWRIKHADLAAYLERTQTAAQVLTLAGSGGAVHTALAAVAKELDLVYSTVSGTAAALKQFQNQAPNLLVVDMDGFKDGWKLIRKVRATSDFGSPKVLLLSRKGLSDRDTDYALRLGANACLENLKFIKDEVQRLLGCSPRMRRAGDWAV